MGSRKNKIERDRLRERLVKNRRELIESELIQSESDRNLGLKGSDERIRRASYSMINNQ